jgi:hypothetical protein
MSDEIQGNFLPHIVGRKSSLRRHIVSINHLGVHGTRSRPHCVYQIDRLPSV